MSLMKKDNEMDGNNSRRTKALAAAVPIAGMIVAATLLMGLSPFSGYYQQIAIAQQQNMTEGTNATSTGGTTATTTGGGAAQSSSVCTPAQTGDGGGSSAGTQGDNTTGTPSNSSPSASSLTGGGAATPVTNATGSENTTAAEGTNEGNQSTTRIAGLIEQACSALQGGNIQAALMQLNSALSELRSGSSAGTQGDNTTGTPSNSSPSASSLTGSG
ncbi:MAG TPA: hypothetical protein VGE97_10940 [Nitrososphaera sp.]